MRAAEAVGDAVRGVTIDGRPPKTPKRKAREYLAECFAALNKSSDRFRSWWDEARPDDRRMLCSVARIPASYAGVPWDRVPLDYQTTIKRRASDMHAWLGRVLAGAAE